VPVPLPVTCRHGVIVAWHYSDQPSRTDRRLASSCGRCGAA